MPNFKSPHKNVSKTGYAGSSSFQMKYTKSSFPYGVSPMKDGRKHDHPHDRINGVPGSGLEGMGKDGRPLKMKSPMKDRTVGEVAGDLYEGFKGFAEGTKYSITKGVRRGIDRYKKSKASREKK